MCHVFFLVPEQTENKCRCSFFEGMAFPSDFFTGFSLNSGKTGETEEPESKSKVIKRGIFFVEK